MHGVVTPTKRRAPTRLEEFMSSLPAMTEVETWAVAFAMNGWSFASSDTRFNAPLRQLCPSLPCPRTLAEATNRVAEKLLRASLVKLRNVTLCYAYLESKKTCSESPYRAHRSESRVVASPAPVVPSPDPVPFAIEEEVEEIQESEEDEQPEDEWHRCSGIMQQRCLLDAHAAALQQRNTDIRGVRTPQPRVTRQTVDVCVICQRPCAAHAKRAYVKCSAYGEKARPSDAAQQPKQHSNNTNN
jgi:hypothetical protein